MNNLTKTRYFTESGEYFKVLFNPSNVVHTITLIIELLICVTYSQADDLIQVMSNTNPVIVAYTTTQALLQFCSHIEQLNEWVLHFDMDHVIIYLAHLVTQFEYVVPTG